MIISRNNLIIIICFALVGSENKDKLMQVQIGKSVTGENCCAMINVIKENSGMCEPQLLSFLFISDGSERMDTICKCWSIDMRCE